jgi:uncharacterized tellurite resistance protein B-like protein
MLRALTDLFDRKLVGSAEGSPSREDELKLATAVLLVEVARADFDEAGVELDRAAELLASYLDMPARDVATLVTEARSRADYAASLQTFTRQLHEELGHDEKLKVIEMLWEVALADESLDKHEDHLIRKLAGLLYVSHSDLIRIRNLVADRRG